MVVAAVADKVLLALARAQAAEVMAPKEIILETERQEQPIQAAVVVVQVITLTQLNELVAQVVQVMHELLIGVNYGTTLCIS
jgi:stress response protein YsnF